MLSINTKANTKLVEVDGYTYNVRRPGAGEALTMQKTGRDISTLGKLTELGDSQIEKLGDLTSEVLAICLNLFKSDDKKAVEYLQTLDVEVLLDVIGKIFETPDEPQAS